MSATPVWRRLIALPTLLCLTVAGLLTLTATDSAFAAKSKREHKVIHALEVARKQKGDPYQYGADGPNSFDCSGLTQFSYAKAGLRLPRTADQQSHFARRLKDRSNIKAGDFMFFASGGHVYHMGLFTGRWKDGRRLILHASRTGTPVKVDPLWTNHWFAGTLRR